MLQRAQGKSKHHFSSQQVQIFTEITPRPSRTRSLGGCQRPLPDPLQRTYEADHAVTHITWGSWGSSSCVCSSNWLWAAPPVVWLSVVARLACPRKVTVMVVGDFKPGKEEARVTGGPEMHIPAESFLDMKKICVEFPRLGLNYEQCTSTLVCLDGTP